MAEEFECLSGGRGVDDRAVNEALKVIWDRLRTEEVLRCQASEAGFDLGALDGSPEPPFAASRDGAYVGFPELLVINIVGGLTVAAIKGLWETVVWPELKTRYPALERRRTRD